MTFTGTQLAISCSIVFVITAGIGFLLFTKDRFKVIGEDGLASFISRHNDQHAMEFSLLGYEHILTATNFFGGKKRYFLTLHYYAYEKYLDQEGRRVGIPTPKIVFAVVDKVEPSLLQLITEKKGKLVIRVRDGHKLDFSGSRCDT